ncbi:DNA polymerase III subunit delta [Shewanella marina]|uniref:DNA polymerase III subunit delta n=1 Tax=Shewanella marina TaxID=487319 RepID=UPI00046E8749|nr:DNA polymerase III subunit delta [Shewanella marina]
MRVFADQLARHLTPLKPYYLIFGDDPWLVESSISQIRSQALKQGFDERVQLTQESGFSWNDLLDEWQSMSLFASRRIIELSLPQSKPGSDGAACLKTISEQANNDLILIIRGPKLAAEQTNSKWFKLLDKDGIYVPCVTPEAVQFQRWLDGRIQHFGLTLDTDAKSLLYSLYEGNLLAADQALQLLQLLSPKLRISAEQLNQYFEDQSRFSVFQLTDALLANKPNKSQHMLAQLRSEGTALTILLWSIFKELNTLLALKQAQASGEQLNNLWGKMRIWDKRKPLYQSALGRLKLEDIERLLSHASQIELKLKQQGIEDWIGISHLCLLFDPVLARHLQHIELS